MFPNRSPDHSTFFDLRTSIIEMRDCVAGQDFTGRELMASYTCPNCGIDFGYPDGLSVHEELGCEWGDDGDDSTEEDNGESLSVEDAALIWLSHGMDEDYTFGYNESQLRDALGSD